MTWEKENKEEFVHDEIKKNPLGEQIENGPRLPQAEDAPEACVIKPDPGIEEGDNKPGLVEILYGTVTAPSETFAVLAKNPPVLKSLFTVAAIYIFTWLLNLSDLRNTGLENLMLEEFGHISGQLLGNMLIAMGFLGIIFVLLIWFVVSGALNLWASLLGGQDNSKGLFVCYGFAMIPSVFSEVLQTLIKLAGLPGVMNWFVAIFAFIWILYLQVTAVKTTQGLSPGLSLFVALTPVLVLGLLILFASLLVFAALLPVYQNFFNI